MFDENQPVTIKWSTHYSNKYKQYKKGSYFTIPAKELTPHSRELVNVICDYCGKNYKTLYSIVTRDGKQACSECAPVKANEYRKERDTKEKFEKLNTICNKKHYILLTKQNEYCGVNMDIEFVCPKHGKQVMMLDNLIRGHECRLCSYEKRGDNRKRTKQNIIKCVEDINGNKLLNPEDYKNVNYNNLNIQCSCGNVFTVSLANYLKRHVDRCPVCSQKESKGELLI